MTNPSTGADAGQPTRTAQTLADTAAAVVLVPVAVARRVLPDRELPVVLGATALAVAGVVEWPAVVAAGLGYAAIRRWTPGGHDPLAQRDDAAAPTHLP